jgi:hypothetical protein
MANKQEQIAGQHALAGLHATINTLELINEHGDLCRDGLRAVNFISHLTNKLVLAIEADEGVDELADALERTTHMT